ncbi:MAG: endolytic transglycosylase MltG, partial [Bacteroidales bacterium]|nr:endolytic transglycosylase MltG [Bacteroidales bacterium]
TRMEVTTLASIVTGETRIAEDMPKIAGVYLNRLKRGMKLQACPTVAYCFDYKPSRILNKHLQVKSPYNTYIHTGLPPGPICSPSKEALTAVLNPDLGGGTLFFCADPAFNGRHRFARTFAEHSRNAREYQKALANRKRQARSH